MKKIIIILFSLIVCANLSFGFILLESSYYGTPERIYTARSLGMGGCSVAEDNGAAGLFGNPATIALSKNIDFSGNLNITRYGEEITRKIVDGFDDVIGDAGYASNTNYYIQPTMIGAIIPLGKFGLPNIINIGLGFSRAYDFSYDYEETFFDNSYVKDYKIDYQIEGQLYDYAFGLSVQPHKAINVGLALHYFKGDWKDTKDKIDFQNPELTYKNAYNKIEDMSGMGFSFGAVFQPLTFAKRLMIGVYGKTPAKIKGDYYSFFINTADPLDREITHPGEYGFGISYMPKNEISSRLSVDIIYTSWSNVEDKVNGEDILEEMEFDNTVGVHLGVEHLLVDNMPVRAGFYYTPLYLNDEINSINFTVG
ncbi:MAG TPA: hypothetical protein ENL09_06325, partial [Bacteroidetes bacterium]|nr:hypothetical protein [Bacteroidota bacterium]